MKPGIYMGVDYVRVMGQGWAIASRVTMKPMNELRFHKLDDLHTYIKTITSKCNGCKYFKLNEVLVNGKCSRCASIARKPKKKKPGANERNARRKHWADGTMQYLKLKDTDY